MTKTHWKVPLLVLILFLFISLSACGGGGSRASGKKISFEDAAQIVIDELVKPDTLDHEMIVFLIQGQIRWIGRISIAILF